MRADKDVLRKEVDELLRRRPGWSLQATATPGALPVWCFGSGGRNDLTVAAERGSIRVYVMKSEREVKLGSTSELVAWLQAREAESLKNPDELLRWERQPEVSVRADKDELQMEVDELLRRRPGWSLQAVATPGTPPVWCYGSGRGAGLTVGADQNCICVYLVDSEREVKLGSTSQLVAWLQAYEPESLRGPQLKRRRFLDWQ